MPLHQGAKTRRPSGRHWSYPLALAVVAYATGAQTGTPSARAQTPGQPPATFRTQTTLVELDVRVADRDGHFVADLTAEDFTQVMASVEEQTGLVVPEDDYPLLATLAGLEQYLKMRVAAPV